MSTTKHVLAGLIMWGAVAALVAGCSSAAPGKTTDHACASTDAFEAAVSGFKDTLTRGATVGEVQAAREEVQRTFKDLMEEGGDVTEDGIEPLNKAVGEFQTAIDEVPDDATLSASTAALQQEIARIDTTRDEYVAALNCG